MSFLHTNTGRIALDSAVPAAEAAEAAAGSRCKHQREKQLDGLDRDNAWITCGELRVLWLPPEFRPWLTAVWASMVIVGCVSRHIILLKL